MVANNISHDCDIIHLKKSVGAMFGGGGYVWRWGLCGGELCVGGGGAYMRDYSVIYNSIHLFHEMIQMAQKR